MKSRNFSMPCNWLAKSINQVIEVNILFCKKMSHFSDKVLNAPKLCFCGISAIFSSVHNNFHI